MIKKISSIAEAISEIKKIKPLVGETKTILEEIYWHLSSRADIAASNGEISIGKGSNNVFLYNILNDLSSQDLRALAKYYQYTLNNNYGATPELDRLTFFLLGLDKNDYNEIFDMYCGNGTFINTILEINDFKNYQNKIYGNQIYSFDEYIATLISKICSIETTQIKIFKKNIFKEELDFDYDRIRIFPPLDLKYPYNNSEIPTRLFKDIPFSNIYNSIWASVDKSLKTNKENFKGVALASGNDLWGGRTDNYKKNIIRKGYLEGIIELPVKALPNSKSKFYLLIFSNNNKEVKFLDASSMITNEKNTFTEHEKVILNVDSIFSNYIDCKCIKTIEETLDMKNLSPSIVTIEKKEIKNGIPLYELAEIFSGNQYTLKNFEGMISEKETGYSILRSNDIDDYIINLKTLIHIDYNANKFDKYCLQYGDVIITSKSSKFKVCVVDFKPQEKIIVTSGMIIVRPDPKKLNSTYLKLFLDSNLGQQALQSIQKGEIIFTINARDLSTIKIPYIDLEQQSKIAAKYSSKVSTLIDLRNKINEIKNQINTIFIETDTK